MNDKPNACIDCHQPCSRYAYRCKACASTEKAIYRHITGTWGTPNTKAGREASRRRNAALRAEKVADIEADLDLGISADRIAAGYGVKRDSLGRFLDRAGRHDLATRMYVTSRQKNHYSQGRTCINCDDRCSNEATFCRSCANAQRARERFARAAA